MPGENLWRRIEKIPKVHWRTTGKTFPGTEDVECSMGERTAEEGSPGWWDSHPTSMTGNRSDLQKGYLKVSPESRVIERAQQLLLLNLLHCFLLRVQVLPLPPKETMGPKEKKRHL